MLSPLSSFMVHCVTSIDLSLRQTPSPVRVRLSTLAVMLHPQRRIMSRVDIGQFGLLHIQHGIDRRDKHALLGIGDEQIIDAAQSPRQG